MNASSQRHILSVSDLSSTEIESIFSRASQFKKDGFSSSIILNDSTKDIPVVALAFFEPSTRTKLSFDAAAQRIGCRTIGFDNPASTSSVKGEQLTDTLNVISKYANCIVIRRKDHDTVDVVSQVNEVPIISAGIGAQEHPTQALLDVFTIQQHRSIESINHVVTYGDLISSRTMNSQLRLLAREGITFTFVSSDDMQITTDFQDELVSKGVVVNKTSDISSVIRDADILHIIRPQKERWEGKEHEAYSPVTQEHFDVMKKDALVLHALPRTGELDPKTDNDPRSLVWEQVQNGMFVRAALLEWILTQ